MSLRLLTLIACLAALPSAAQECGSRLFVSGWNSTVHVFDACTGTYLKDLDTQGRLGGAMAVRLGPDGLLYAVSELDDKIHRYRNDTLEYAGLFATAPARMGATGLAFDAAGIAHVAGYRTDDVKRFDRNGGLVGTAFPARASGLDGPDSGMTFAPDGNLYVPGWESHSVVRWDPRTGQTSVAVAPRASGLFNARGLLASRDGASLFVTSEGSGLVLKVSLASGAVNALASGITRPTGIDYAPDGKLLVSSGESVIRLDPDSGARLGTLVAEGAGGIAGQVFLAVIARPAAAASVDATQVGTQYWVVGDGRFSGRVLQLDNVVSATGTGFGAALRFAELAIKRWGSVRIELVSCTEARFSWDSASAGSAGFGRERIHRALPRAGHRCRRP